MRFTSILASALLAAAVVGAPSHAGVASAVPATAGGERQPPAAETSTHPGSKSPEDAVREYLAAVADADVEGILSTTAVDELSRAFRFDLLVDRISAFTFSAPGPVHEPFFAEIQHAGWQTERLIQVRWLVYSLLAADTLGEAIDLAVVTDVDGAWARGLQEELDPQRLSSLEVVDIGVPEPGLAEDPRYQDNLARSAEIYGADEQTDRVALVTFEDETYAIGFTLLRFGDTWKVFAQSSAISGLPMHGVAQPISAEAFAELTSE